LCTASSRDFVFVRRNRLPRPISCLRGCPVTDGGGLGVCWIGARRSALGARRWSLLAPLALIGYALALSACGGDTGEEEVRDIAVRDSAGISIVESGRAPSRPFLMLDTSAVVEIGETLDENPDYQLFQVASALRLSGGTIVVANRGSHQLKLYDSTGRFVRNMGRKGGGPGEF